MGAYDAAVFLLVTGASGAGKSTARQSLALQAQGRDLLLAGDPVAAGELIAAPSADQLDTSGLDADAVAAGLVAWCRRALSGQAPAMRVGA